MAMKIQFRRDTAASWTSNNPVLLEGELGLDTTNDHFKIGDGTTNWNTLLYSYGDWNTIINKPSTFTPSAGGSVGQVLTNVSNGVGTWQDAAGGVNLTSATTAPASPTAGDQWFDTANGILYAYMTDGTQTQWLDISSANGQAAAAAAAGGGAMELISANIVTTNTTIIEFTGITGYTRYQLQMNCIRTVHDTFPKLYFGDSSSYASSYFKNSTSGRTEIVGGTSGENSYTVCDITNLTVAAPTLMLMDAVVRPIANNTLYTARDGFAETSSTVFSKIKITTGFSFVSGSTFSLYGFKDS